MTFSFRPAAFTLMTLGLLCGPVHAKVLDRTLASVNGDPIMLSEFEKNASPILDQFKKAAPAAEQTPEHVADIKKRILDQMIDDRLLVGEAKRKNIKVSQLEVDDGVKKVRSRFTKPDGSLDEDQFNKEMQKEGMTYEEFRKHIQDQLMTIKLIDQEVKSKVPPPSDSEIKDLYDTLDAILHDKPIPAGHTPSEIDEMKSLAKAVDHRFGERVRARHILVRVAPDAPKADRDAALARIKEAQAKLKKGEDFAAVAKKYSDDPGSKDRGGDLGYFGRGDMVPQFDKAVASLNVGQTSDIVTTEFGYHLIQVQEKKAASPMALDEIKDDLREYLYQQRGAKRFDTYVKDLRAKADVKINNLE